MSPRKKLLGNNAKILFCPLNGEYKIIPARTSKRNLGTLTDEFSSQNDRKPLILFVVKADDNDPDDRYLVTEGAQAEIDQVMFDHLKDMLAAENIGAIIPRTIGSSLVITAETTDEQLAQMRAMRKPDSRVPSP